MRKRYTESRLQTLEEKPRPGKQPVLDERGEARLIALAHQMQWLIDERYPEADVIRVVLDNLNTHGPGSLYDAFKPAEAR